MAKSLESPTKLTEFGNPPLHPESPQNVGIRSTFARWFGIKTSSPPQSAIGTIKEGLVVSDCSPDEATAISQSIDDFSSISSSSTATYTEGRNLVSVLTRVSNLLAQKGVYNDEEFKRYWMPDSVSKECYECSYKFTALRRRHHCRICGQIFCSRCCHQQVPGKLMGYSGDLRACTYCCGIVLSCLQSIDPLAESSPTDLARIQEDLQKKLAMLLPSFGGGCGGGGGSSHSSPVGAGLSGTGAMSVEQSGDSSKGRGTLKRKVSVSFQEERFAASGSSTATAQSTDKRTLLHDAAQLKALQEEMTQPQSGIVLQSHRYKLRSYANCYVGSEIIDWLLVRDKAGGGSSRIQATALAQALMEAGHLECLSTPGERLFVDGYSLYRPVKSNQQEPELVAAATAELQQQQQQQHHSPPPEADEEPLNWVSQHNQESKTEDPEETEEDHHHHHHQQQQQLQEDATQSPSDSVPLEEDSATQLLADLFESHIHLLMRQLLEWHGLSQTWAEVLAPLVQSLAHAIRPDVRDDDDDMDVRTYVHIKKVPGGGKMDSRIVHGVVCSKNVANRSMPKWSHDPNILLLSSAIDYQRVENKLISLEPLMMQENEYLKNAVAKIAAFKPDVLLVEKVVSGVAQEFLHNLGLTLVLNVKPSVMDRVSRCCQADIVPSIDVPSSSRRPRLGSCRLFHVETLADKTLMFFDGCQPRLGATVLLRGASSLELRKVKRIFRFMVFACYNGRLERAFLTDEFAVPKTLGCWSPPRSDDRPSPDGRLTHSHHTLESSSIVIVDSPASTADSETTNHQASPSTFSSSTNSSCSASAVTGTVRLSVAAAATGDQQLQPVSELNDPLHEYLRTGEDQSLSTTPIFPHQQQQQLQSDHLNRQTLAINSMLFRKALEDTILSVSPLVRHGLPYLETEAGRNAPLRQFLPQVLYHSQQLKPTTESPPRKLRYVEQQQTEDYDKLDSCSGSVSTTAARRRASNSELLHPFLRARITPSMSKTELLSLLSDFRARGVRPTHPPGLTHSISATTAAVTKNKMSLTSSDDWENISTDGEQNHHHSGGGGGSGGGGTGPKDCLDPFNQQRLCVLFSSYCPSLAIAPNYCVSPWVVDMDFYGRNDIALGGFLERYCFHTQYACPSSSCQAPMASHVRRFVHDTSSILVIIRQLANPVNSSNTTTTTTPTAAAVFSNPSISVDRSILMWSWCKKCKQVSPIATMSAETWHFSFAKYLELRFYGHAYCRRQMNGGGCAASAPVSCACSHPLHTEHFHYFGCRDLVASFKYAPIQLKEIVLAPGAIAMQPETDLLARLIEDIRQVAQHGHGLYTSLAEWLQALMAECMGGGGGGGGANSSSSNKLETQLATMVEQSILERNRFRKRVEEIQLMLTSPNLSTTPATGSVSSSSCAAAADGEQLSEVNPSPKAAVATASSTLAVEESLWNISDHLVLLKRIIADTVWSWNGRLQEVVAAKKKEDKASASKSTPVQSNQKMFAEVTGTTEATTPKITSPVISASPTDANSSREDSSNTSPMMPTSSNQQQQPQQSPSPSSVTIRRKNRSRSSSPKADGDGGSGGGNGGSPFVRNRSTSEFLPLPSAIDTNFQQQLEDPQLMQQQMRRSRSASQASNSTDVSMTESSATASEGTTIVAAMTMTAPPPFSGLQAVNKTPVPSTPSASSSTHSRLSLLALLSAASTPSSLLTSPFPPTEHHLLPPGSSLPLVVYQNEPSSIIAYALSSVDYEHQLAELQADLADQLATAPSSPPRTSSPVGPDRWFDNVEREEPAGKVGGAGALPSSSSLSGPTAPIPSSNQHVEIQFSDQSTKFYCRIYYAEQFRALRSRVFPCGEERFIRSLARCAPWAASGGKSGSTFCKTLDDRFVLKQMSKMEIQSFVDLAPNYIAYTQRALRENRPTAFCKIVGAFRIVYKNATTNVASKQDLLVMENLFYRRNVTRKFDLKGSERNRLASASESDVNDCVLLDENFMKMIWETPLYVRGYSQGVLNKALQGDTQFLASQSVMDYSLLVGIDDETNQLIVGLIDYIRTFTWDKRLETFVKSSGILGGQGKMPTVVSPELYRTRFCDAMNRYFTAVPSFWD